MAILKYKNTDGTWEIFESPGAIKYFKQNLTDEEKVQARANIGAASDSDLNALSTLVGEKPVSEQIDEAITEIGLPEITEADDGKILGVVGDTWAIVNAPEGGNGNDATVTGLPDVSKEDDGRVLGVINGEWTIVDTIITNETVFAETKLEFTNNSSLGGYAHMGDNLFVLNEGDKYLVSWDGTEYVCTSYLMTQNGTPAITLGNEAYTKGETTENSEPFIIYYVPSNIFNGLVAFDTESSHTIAIYKHMIGLPEVTTDDEGKVLGIVDGKWQKMTIEVSSEGGNSDSSVQPDYAQNDETAADYIKNRPFYETTIRTEIMPESTLTFTNNATWDAYAFDTTPTTEQLEVWQSDWNKVTVVWNGTSYICEPQDYHGIKVVGNLLAYKGTGDNEMPFVFGVGGADIFGENYVVVLSVYDTQENNHEVAVFMSEEIITKIDSKYLPETNTLPEVTIDDNGKTLVVSTEGKWTVGESTGGSGECNLPEIDEGSKVSIIPETTLKDFYYIIDYQMYGCNDSSVTINLPAGDTCNIVWDGEKHTCTVVDMSSIMSGALGLGNLSFAGIESNNEPFAIGFFTDGGVTFLSTTDEAEGNSHTVEIYQGTPSTDEGKFLQVVNGKWTAVTIEFAEGGGF